MNDSDQLDDLINNFKKGNIRSLAKLISRIENEDAQKDEILKGIFNKTGKAHIIGVTGSPGSGKSSLVDYMTAYLRKKGQTVGVVAVDPTSPFSGGAILGDRIRMQDHALDRGVYIRSMGTRGSLGGLARNTKEVVKLLDAFGFQWLIIETVGVGQAELDIMNVADTTMVILTPGAGDSIQAIKAGIMEIADIFVVNKCDLPGADRVTSEITLMLELKGKYSGWHPPIVQVSTLEFRGIDELMKCLDNHRLYLSQSGMINVIRENMAKKETLEIINYKWQKLIDVQLNNKGYVNDVLDSVKDKKNDPYTAADEILEYIFKNFGFNNKPC